MKVTGLWKTCLFPFSLVDIVSRGYNSKSPSQLPSPDIVAIFSSYRYYYLFYTFLSFLFDSSPNLYLINISILILFSCLFFTISHPLSSSYNLSFHSFFFFVEIPHIWWNKYIINITNARINDTHSSICSFFSSFLILSSNFWYHCNLFLLS